MYSNVPTPQRPPPRPGQYRDPYAQQAASIFGPPQNDRQIAQRARQQAQAQIKPLLAMLTAEINKRSAAEQAHLGAATQNYEQMAGRYAPQAAAAYGGAEQSQAAINSALAQALAGGGAQQASELGGKLAQIGAPAALTAQVAGGAAERGIGAGNASLATGSAELSRLLAQGTAAQDYGAKLPGIAGAAGLQRSGEIAGKYASELDTRTAEINAKLPALIADLLTSGHASQAQRARDVASYENTLANRDLQGQIAQNSGLVSQYNAQTARQRVGATASHYTAEEKATAARLGISEAQLQERRREANVRARQNASAQKERSRHNRATEKKGKGKSSTTPPWQKKK